MSGGVRLSRVAIEAFGVESITPVMPRSSLGSSNSRMEEHFAGQHTKFDYEYS